MNGGAAPEPLSPRRRDIVLVAAVALLLDLPILLPHYYASHDLLEALSYFDYLYSGLLHDHAVPQWDPLVFYGIRTGILQFPLPSFAYALGLLGWATGWHDSPHLLYLSLAAERVFFAVSLYYLALTLYRTRIAAVLVPCLSAAAVFWFFVPTFNLYAIAFLPLALLCLLRFWRSASWSWLWLSGAALSVSVTIPYLGAATALCFGAITVALLLQHPSPGVFLSRPSLGATAAFLLCVLLLAAVGLLLAHALEGFDLVAPSRGDAASVALRAFLHYSVSPTLDAVAQAFVLGWTPTAQWPSYFGLLPLVGALAAVFLLDGKILRALALGAFVVLLLTNASEAAVAMFHVPAMQYFRHLQHLFPILKVFLALLAGFAFDRMVAGLAAPRGPRWLRPWPLLLAWLGLAALVDAVAGPVLRAADPSILSDFGLGAPPLQGGAVLAAYLSYLRVAAYGLAGLAACLLIRRGPARPRVLAALLVAAVVFDLASYQWQAFQQWQWDRTDDPAILAAFRPRPPSLPLERERAPSDATAARVIAGFAEHARALRSTNYALYETLLGFDRCFPVARVHYLAGGPARLITLRGGHIVPGAVGSEVPWHDEALMTVLGCGSPKFRLVPNAVVAGSVEQREQLIRGTPALDRTVILGPLEGRPAPPVVQGLPPTAGSVRLTGYSADRIELAVDNPSPDPVWLVYADAYDPGWSATVEGAAAPTYRAYGAFKAVSVPPGKSRVEWRFDAGWWAPPLLALRLLPGLAGLAALLTAICWPGAVWRLVGGRRSATSEPCAAGALPLDGGT
ncbi:hypothetical protein SAMN06265365_12847 [Tistlia consotensis]|uniref:Membrane protein YfhO n=1 Tax=Tistlia consotensis USBA 355 TaxID=560819 RepID=A0A1Y6CRV2_9PROT|nr:hypothetical protein [Tistlia consotensis]SMF71435.1 hypothetical protein SAMN05428998_13035 [Tistlia consotensis USBA 355]SNS06674.1 hypothetical protein SAMN06265365_12847 [Tistlia consotensis]